MSENNNQKVVKAGIGYTVGNYLLKGLTFLTIPIFSRLMSTTDYGIYNTFTAFENILFILIGLAIHTSYKNARYKYKFVEEGSESGKDYNTYVSTTMVMLIVSVVVWLSVTNVFAKPISNAIGLNQFSVNLLLLFSFSNAVLLCFNSDVAIRYEFQSFLKISSINAVGNIVLSIVLMMTVFKEQRYMGRVLGTVVPIFFLSIYIIVKFIKKAKPQNCVPFLKWGVRYSIPIVPHGISQVILSQFDRIMINNMIGASTAGIYSFAYNIYTIVNVTIQSLDSVWNQWFYEQMNQKAYEEIRKKSSMYMIGMLLFSSVLLLVSPEMIKILGDKPYWEAIYCVIPIIAAGYFSFLYTIPSAVEYYYEKTKFIAVGSLGAATINIILNYVFISKYGYIAAAYTTLFTYILYFVFHFVLASKIHKSCIFSIRTVLCCSIFMLGVNFFSLIYIESILKRWVVAFVLVLFLWYLEKKMNIISRILKRGKKNG